MVLTFFWAIIVMSPLAVLENLWNWLTTIRSGLMAEASVDRTNNAAEWGWFLLLEFVGVRLLPFVVCNVYATPIHRLIYIH